MPDLVIIGGPNGAGKSTIFPAINLVSRQPGSFEPELIENNNFINADNIAKEYNIDDIAAARKTLKKVDELIQAHKNIAIESTLSGKWLLGAIKKARSENYRIYIFYIIIESPELSMLRVTQRALLGKHYISMNNILKRYNRSLINFFTKYKSQADFWLVSDNSNILTKPLIWGGKVYNNDKIYSSSNSGLLKIKQTLEFNNINLKIDESLLDLNDKFTPIVIKNVQNIVEGELANRPRGNYISVSENFKISFVKFQ